MTDREMYLKTQQLADALGVSPSSVKRWVDKGAIQATKTMGKHRLVSLSSALKFARDGKYPTDGLIALSSQPTIDQIDQVVVDALVDALKAGEAEAARSVVASVFLATRDAVALADQLIRPVMERVGHLWMVGGWDIYHEHQATQLLVRTLVELIKKAPGENGPERPLAIGAAPEGDIYNLPTLLGELVLREAGWDVRNLGNDLPLRSLALAIRSYRPKLVFLSASVITDESRFLQEYGHFQEAAAQVGAAIIMGGRALDANLRSRLANASFGDRMADLADFADRLLQPNQSALRPLTNPNGPIDIATN